MFKNFILVLLFYFILHFYTFDLERFKCDSKIILYFLTTESKSKLYQLLCKHKSFKNNLFQLFLNCFCGCVPVVCGVIDAVVRNILSFFLKNWNNFFYHFKYFIQKILFIKILYFKHCIKNLNGIYKFSRYNISYFHIFNVKLKLKLVINCLYHLKLSQKACILCALKLYLYIRRIYNLFYTTQRIDNCNIYIL